jgi:Tol biopolymer transport system component
MDNGSTVYYINLESCTAGGCTDKGVLAYDNTTHDTYPTWSPDGSEIAFVRRDKNSDDFAVYTMNADGSNLTQIIMLTDTAIRNLDWSPAAGSRQVVLETGTVSGTEIKILDLDTGQLSPVPDTIGGETVPSWSPDGWNDVCG